MEFKPGIGPAGLCRVVVIELKDQTVLHKRIYRGTMANLQPLPHDQLEVTWAEGGAVRIKRYVIEIGTPLLIYLPRHAS